MAQYGKKLQLNWRKVASSTGITPKARHGHRVVNINQLMIIFGGGCDGIVEEVSIYNTATNTWQIPEIKGDIPPGRAAFGLASDGPRIYIFGGMMEYGVYSNDLFELQVSKWEWKKLSPKAPTTGESPCRRIGLSFTMVGKRIFLFGGLANKSNDPLNNIPVYLNDLYILNLKQNVLSWEIPVTYGEGPSVRESHSAVAYYDDINQKNYLVIYGGMNGNRLGDTWFLDTDSMKWEYPKLKGPLPLPRSLHTTTLIGHKMYVFGGWTPSIFNALRETEWICTNTVGCLDLKTLTWEGNSMRAHDKGAPKARAGHCAVAIGGRIYIWSGRDGFRGSSNVKDPSRIPQVCWNDLWFLETLPPPKASKIKLVKTTVNSIELMWNVLPGVSHYLLQVQKVENNTQTPAKVEAESKITSNLIVRKPLVNSPSHFKKIPIPQIIANPGRVHIISQEIFKQPYPSPPKHIMVNPKRSVGSSESSHKPNIIFDNRAIVIAKPTTTYQVVKKMPLGSLGSFKITDKDGMPVNVVQKVSVNTVPSTSQFRIVDKFKQQMTQSERTVTFRNSVRANNDDGSSENELSIDTYNDDESDKIDQLDGISDQEAFQIKNISNHHLGLDEASNDSSSDNDDEESGQNDETEAENASHVLTPIEEFNQTSDSENWDTVDILEDCRHDVISFISYNEWNISKVEGLTLDNIPDLTRYKRALLEAGNCYKFRVAGINSLGIGDFSETDEFNTNSNSISGAPHTVRIGKQKDGIMICWMPPKIINSEIHEYVVLMAAKQDYNSIVMSTSFERVYSGKNTQCLVKYKTIQKAHVDNDSTRPSITFRISARNDYGHGTATQVKWIQDHTFSPKRTNETEINNNDPIMKKKCSNMEQI